MSVPVQVPVDVDREDRVLGDLTARQVLILLVAAIGAYAVWSLTGPEHLVWCAVGVAPLALAAVVLAFGRRDGIALDRLLLAAARQRLAAPTRPGPMPPEADRDLARGESRAGARRGGRGRPVAPQVPVRGIHSVTPELGVLDLAHRGMAVVCVVEPINLAMRSESEQEAALAGFGRWLHALTTSVQILSRTRRLDLGEVVAAVGRRAEQLAHPALADAARDHAAHLAGLAHGTELTSHETLLIFRNPTPARTVPGGRGLQGRGAWTAVELLWRRVDEAAALLGPIGLRVRVLDAPSAARVVRAATDPGAPPEPIPAPQIRRPGPRTGAARRPAPAVDDDPPTVPIPVVPAAPRPTPQAWPDPYRPARPGRPHPIHHAAYRDEQTYGDEQTYRDGGRYRDELGGEGDADGMGGMDGMDIGDDVDIDAENADREASGWWPGRISAALDGPSPGPARTQTRPDPPVDPEQAGSQSQTEVQR